MRNASGLLAYALCAVVISLSACTKRGSDHPQATFPRASDLHGSVYFCSWEEGGSLSKQGFSKYEVNLDRGTVSLVERKSAGSVHDINVPPGTVYPKDPKLLAQLSSPDGRYLASWLEPAPNGGKALRVSEPATHLQVGFLAAPVGADIASLAWSADSSSLAVLTEKESVRYDRYPDFLWPLFGHGVPRSDFDLFVISAKNGQSLQVPLTRDVPFSAVAYVQWATPKSQ